MYCLPNSEFVSSRVVNWSHGDPTVRLDLPVGVSYDSDFDVVVKALREVADENNKILKEPRAEVFFANFGDSSWNLELRVLAIGSDSLLSDPIRDQCGNSA